MPSFRRNVLLGDDHGVADTGPPGPALLASFQLQAPPVQSFPTTTAGCLAVGLPEPDHIWTLDETAGDFIDRVGTEDLDFVADGATALRGRETRVNAHATEKLGLELLDLSNGAARAKTNTAFNFGATSFAGLICWRGYAGTTTRGFMGKRDGLAPNQGWEFYMPSTGRPTLLVDDGGSLATASSDPTAVASGGPANCFAFRVDRTADDMRIFVAGRTPSAPVAIAGLGSLDTTGINFSIGKGRLFPGHGQSFYALIFTGANAEALDQTALDTFWTHATDSLGQFDTYSRGGAAVYDLAASGKVQAYGDHQIAQVYRQGLNAGAGGYGSLTHGTINNFVSVCVPSTDEGWSGVTATVTDNAVDAPSGLKDGALCVGGAASTNAQVWRQITNLVQSTTYTVSWWALAPAPYSGTTFEVRENQASTKTFQYAPTATLQRFTWTTTTDVAQTQMQLRFFTGETGVDTDKTIHIWGVQVNPGPTAYPLAYTVNAPGTIPALDARATIPVIGSTGEIRSRFVVDANSPNNIHHVYAVRENATTVNVKTLRPQNSGGNITIRGLIYDNVSALPYDQTSGVAGALGDEIRVSQAWDAASFANMDIQPANLQIPVATSWTDGGTAAEIVFGQLYNLSSHMYGAIASIDIYAEDTDTPP